MSDKRIQKMVTMLILADECGVLQAAKKMLQEQLPDSTYHAVIGKFEMLNW